MYTSDYPFKFVSSEVGRGGDIRDGGVKVKDRKAKVSGSRVL